MTRSWRTALVDDPACLGSLVGYASGEHHADPSAYTYDWLTSI